MFQVVVANAGDAKAVLARSTSTDGEGALADTKSPLKAIVLTREHKAIFPQERSRIQKVNSFMVPTFSSVLPHKLCFASFCMFQMNQLPAWSIVANARMLYHFSWHHKLSNQI